MYVTKDRDFHQICNFLPILKMATKIILNVRTKESVSMVLQGAWTMWGL